MRSANQSLAFEILIEETSMIFFSAMRTFKYSFFSRMPWHSGQIFCESSMPSPKQRGQAPQWVLKLKNLGLSSCSKYQSQELQPGNKENKCR